MTVRTTTIEIYINKKRLDDSLYGQIRSLTFDHAKKTAKTGTLVISDNSVSLYDSKLFKLDQQISFKCGWKNEVVDLGPFVIKASAPTFPSSGDITLKVDFQDLSHNMNKKQTSALYIGKTQYIIEKIAKKFDLTLLPGDIENIPDKEYTEAYPSIQSNCTYAAHINKMIGVYGSEWSIERDTLRIHPPGGRKLKVETNDNIVLSYRIGDCSIRSFSPTIRFSKGGIRKNAKVGSSNIDFLKGPVELDLVKDHLRDMGLDDSYLDTIKDTDDLRNTIDLLGIPEGHEATKEINGLFSVESIKSAVGSTIEAIGSTFTLDPGQAETDMMDKLNSDFEKSAQNPSKSPATDKLKSALNTQTAWDAKYAEEDPPKRDGGKDGAYFANVLDGTYTWVPGTGIDEDELTTETSPGNEYGVATPSDADDAKAIAAGRVIAASTTIEASLIPTIPSMKYAVADKLILNGLGKRLSGAYTIESVSHSLSGTGDSFSTSIKVTKKEFHPSAAAKKAIAQKESRPDDSAPLPGTGDTREEKPAKKEEELVYLNELDSIWTTEREKIDDEFYYGKRI